jgi:ferredoxin--NADP+ reductase
VNAKIELLRGQLRPVATPGSRRIHLRYGLTPTRIVGAQRVEAVEFGGETVPAGLVLSSIGYRGVPISDLPFDPDTATVPNDQGRVQPGTYVAGWIKRGPTGFIGTNRSCAQETVKRLVDDSNAGLLARDGGLDVGRRRDDALTRLRSKHAAEQLDRRQRHPLVVRARKTAA